MITVPGRIRLLAEMSDPWIRTIAAALPLGSIPICVNGPLPDWDELAEADPDGVWIVHRSVMHRTDFDWLRAAAESQGRERRRVILVLSSNVRFHQVQRCLSWVDRVVHEATAAELLGVILEAQPSRGPYPRVAIVGSNHELLMAIGVACRRTGYDTRIDHGSLDGVSERLVVWEVPVLDGDWEKLLRRAGASKDRQVITLIGLAERQDVEKARLAGASACLDLPCDPEVLIGVLNRVARRVACGPGEGGQPGLFRGPHASRRGLRADKQMGKEPPGV